MEATSQSFLTVATADGQEKELRTLDVFRAFRPNRLTAWGRLRVYASRLWEFVSGDPRESNTEGGIFPAIFGTVMMVHAHERGRGALRGAGRALPARVRPPGRARAHRAHRRQQPGRRALHRLRRLRPGLLRLRRGREPSTAPSIPEALPTPTFGTGGILWASLTLALLTVPVVIVAAEEALAAVPRSMREASLAAGATKWQTIQRVVLPAAAPGILTGLILAMARGAGEVAPLMITGVVKLAPDLPLDGFFPFLHLDRKFMHLGFHIYDVGFQSPNVEAAKPMVYTTTILLLLAIVVAPEPDRHRGPQPAAPEVPDLGLLRDDMAEAEPSSTRACASRRRCADARGQRGHRAGRHRAQGREPELRRQPRPARHLHGHRREDGHRVHRPLRLRQVHPAALPQPDERPHRRHDDHGDASRVKGLDIYAPKTDVIEVRRRIGMVFQKSNPFPKSIFENVVYGLRIAGIGDKATLDEAGERSLRGAALWDEVKDRLEESGLSLSGGQQQRLCIARAIAVEPEIVLMDEPCSALDPIATVKIEELIYGLKEHYTIVIVTHNLQQAARVSDKTAFFWLGRLVEYGVTSADVHEPAGEADRGLHHGPVRLTEESCMETAPLRDASCRRSRTGSSTWGPWSRSACTGRSRPSWSATSSAAEAIVRGDQEVNELQIEIDDRCLKLLALQQPMASDLRLITAAMKINADLERIGDQAVNIAENAMQDPGRTRPSSPSSTCRAWPRSRSA